VLTLLQAESAVLFWLKVTAAAGTAVPVCAVTVAVSITDWPKTELFAGEIYSDLTSDEHFNAESEAHGNTNPGRQLPHQRNRRTAVSTARARLLPPVPVRPTRMARKARPECC
jgi:hypothetical protein